jgi:formate-dependent nitrite reductase membrane component NrfD
MSPAEWPSTLFTAPPHWRWLIVGYFFVGGLAGGCYFLAVLIDLFGTRGDRPLARLGYYLAFPAVLLSGVFLILDLERPLRFWHMLVQSNTGWPMWKPYSPMSIGSWALLVFGLFSFLAFLGALREAGRLRWSWPSRVRPPGLLGSLIAIVGGIFAFFIAGYTGVLLADTNRPIWCDTPQLGLNFVISEASTSAELLILLGRRRRWSAGVRALERFDAAVLVLELVALVALLASLGSMLRLWLDAWGLLLFVGVIGLGILLPLLLYWRPKLLRPGLRPAVAALLVLVGGFLFRMVVVLSADGIRWPL